MASITGLQQYMLADSRVMEKVYSDLTRDYYASADWSIPFYVSQAVRGFIAVGHVTAEGHELLLPQIQRSYCVMDLANVPKHKSLLKQIRRGGYRLKFNCAFSKVFAAIHEYHGSGKSWLCPAYQHLCKQMHAKGPIRLSGIPDLPEVSFRLVSVELYSVEGELVAGEIGYVVGASFTSLSGFCVRAKTCSVGKMQIFAMAHFLARCGFEFLNLGQPPMDGVMQYKSDLGGVDVSRETFLRDWWRPAIGKPNPTLDSGVDVDLVSLFGDTPGA